ncbi:MAG: hypothetical protein R3D32_13580 [Nitratireductor sp.]
MTFTRKLRPLLLASAAIIVFSAAFNPAIFNKTGFSMDAAFASSDDQNKPLLVGGKSSDDPADHDIGDDHDGDHDSGDHHGGGDDHGGDHDNGSDHDSDHDSGGDHDGSDHD